MIFVYTLDAYAGDVGLDANEEPQLLACARVLGHGESAQVKEIEEHFPRLPPVCKDGTEFGPHRDSMPKSHEVHGVVHAVRTQETAILAEDLGPTISGELLELLRDRDERRVVFPGVGDGDAELAVGDDRLDRLPDAGQVNHHRGHGIDLGAVVAEEFWRGQLLQRVSRGCPRDVGCRGNLFVEELVLAAVHVHALRLRCRINVAAGRRYYVVALV
mmetsp:Transcript_93090/g.199653  ORF Transcript_93090/g.199653 Transcript_93090/m.199653 type:complete len:216 (-) Transcript_93090:110-757(-)